jgi:hypothetical protein
VVIYFYRKGKEGFAMDAKGNSDVFLYDLILSRRSRRLAQKRIGENGLARKTLLPIILHPFSLILSNFFFFFPSLREIYFFYRITKKRPV